MIFSKIFVTFRFHGESLTVSIHRTLAVSESFLGLKIILSELKFIYKSKKSCRTVDFRYTDRFSAADMNRQTIFYCIVQGCKRAYTPAINNRKKAHGTANCSANNWKRANLRSRRWSLPAKTYILKFWWIYEKTTMFFFFREFVQNLMFFEKYLNSEEAARFWSILWLMRPGGWQYENRRGAEVGVSTKCLAENSDLSFLAEHLDGGHGTYTRVKWSQEYVHKTWSRIDLYGVGCRVRTQASEEYLYAWHRVVASYIIVKINRRKQRINDEAINGYITQWLERLTADQQVPGSNPGVPLCATTSLRACY